MKVNTLYNLTGAVVPLIASVVTVPLYLEVIGLERFGIMSLFWVLLGYFGLFDMGLGRSISQRLASLRESPSGDRSRVFWAGLTVSLVVGAVGAMLLVPVSRFVLDLVRFGTPAIAEEIRTAAPILALTLPITLVSGVFSGALVGMERFGLVNAIEGATNVLTIVGPLVLAILLGPALPHLIAGSLAIRAASALALLAACRKSVPLGRPTRPTSSTVRPLLNYGGWVAAESIVGAAIAMWDRFAVGAALGAAAVSIYVIPANLTARLVILPAALVRTLFPRLAPGSEAKARALVIGSAYGLALIFAPTTIAMVALAEPLFRIWLGPALAAPSARVAEILLPSIYANGIALIFFTHLQARGRPAIVAKLHLIEILPYFGLLYLMMRTAGVTGAAVAWSVRTILDAGLLAWLAGIGGVQIWRMSLLFLPVLLSSAIALILPFTSALFWLIEGVLLAVATIQCAMAAPPQLKTLISRRFAMVVRLERAR